MASSKVALSLNILWAKILKILGYSLEIILLIGLIVYISSGMIDAAITCIVFMAIFSLLLITSAKINQRIIRFKKYTELISLENTTSLDLIALKTSQSIDFVKKDIQTMIDKKFFAKAYINKDTNEIIISKESKKESSTKTPVSNQSTIKAVTPVSCNCCGAMNEIVKGEITNCEYCGSPLR